MTTNGNNGNGKPDVNVWALVPGIVTRPAWSFRAMRERVNRRWLVWLLPALLVIATLVVFTAINAPYQAELQRELAEQRLASMPPEQAAQAEKTIEMMSNVPVIVATGAGFGAVVLFIGWLIMAVVLYFGSLLMGGEPGFGTVFSVAVWCSIPAAIRNLTLAAYTFARGQMVKYTGLSALLASGNYLEDVNSWQFILLSQLDLFMLWAFVLLVIGVSTVARISKFKAFIIALVLTLLRVGFPALTTLIFGGMAG